MEYKSSEVYRAMSYTVNFVLISVASESEGTVDEEHIHQSTEMVRRPNARKKKKPCGLETHEHAGSLNGRSLSSLDCI